MGGGDGGGGGGVQRVCCKQAMLHLLETWELKWSPRLCSGLLANNLSACPSCPVCASYSLSFLTSNKT